MLQSATVTYGEAGVFHCEGYGGSINWTIDDTNVTSMSQEMIELRGINITAIIHSDYGSFYGILSTLSISGNCFNNYSTVQCTLYACNGVNYERTHPSQAILRVEGKCVSCACT